MEINMAKRQDIFNDPIDYTARKDYLGEFGISSEVGSNKYASDALTAEMDRLKKNQEIAQRRIDISREAYESKAGIKSESSLDTINRWGEAGLEGVLTGLVGTLTGHMTPPPVYTQEEKENEPIKDRLQYITSGVLSTADKVASSINPLVLFDKAYQLSDMVVKQFSQIIEATPYLYNGDFKTFADEAFKPFKANTFTKSLKETHTAFGGSEINTDNIKDQTVKAIVEDINKGTNVFEGMSKRNVGFYDDKQQQVVDKVGYGTKIIGDVLNSIPQMALMLTPAGMGAYAASSLSQGLSARTKDGQVTDKDVKYVLADTTVEVASEMIFGLFANSTSLVAGALSRVFKKGIKPTVGMAIKGITMQGIEEGLEEIIAFPFQTFLDWKYNNPENTLADYTQLDTLKSWGEAGLVGFLAGAMMSTPAGTKNYLNAKQAYILKQEVKKILESDVDNIPESSAKIVIDLVTEANLGKQHSNATGDVSLETNDNKKSNALNETLRKLDDSSETKTESDFGVSNSATVETLKYQGTNETTKATVETVNNKYAQAVNEYNNASKRIDELYTDNITEKEKQQIDTLKSGIQNSLDNAKEEFEQAKSEIISKLKADTDSSITLEPDKKGKQKATPKTMETEQEGKAAVVNDTKALSTALQSKSDIKGGTTNSSVKVDKVPSESKKVVKSDKTGSKVNTTKSELKGKTLKQEVISDVPVRTKVKEAIATSPTGNKVTSSLKSNENIEADIKAVSIKNLFASIDEDAVKTKGFPGQYQNRQTDSIAARSLISNISQIPDFFKLTMLEQIGEGTPVITSDGYVIAGNHRIAAMLKMQRDNPSKYKEYVSYLKQNASKFGLNPSDISSDTILVRVLPDNVDAAEVASITNEPTKRTMTASEYAVNDNKALLSAFSKFIPNDSGNIDSAANQNFIREFFDKAMSETEASQYRQDNGSINRDGIARIEYAMFYAAYGSDTLLQQIASATKPKSKRLTNSMLNVVPKILAHKIDIENGVAYDLDIGGEIGKAAERYIAYENDKKNIDLYARNMEIGESDASLREKNMLIGISKNGTSVPKLTEYLTLAVASATATGNPKEQMLPGFGEPSLNDVIEAISRKEILDAQIEIGEREVGATDTKEPVETKPTIKGETKDTSTITKKVEPKGKQKVVKAKAETIKEESKITPFAQKLINRTEKGSSFKTRTGGENPTSGKISINKFVSLEGLAEKKMAQAFSGVPTIINGVEYTLSTPIKSVKADAFDDYSKTVDDVSSTQNSTRNLGIVAKGFKLTDADSNGGKPKTIYEYDGPAIPKVREAFDRSKRPDVKKQLSFVEKFKDFVTKNFLRASVPEVDYEKGQTRANVIKYRKRWKITSTLTWEEIKGIYEPITKNLKKQMDYAVFLPDLVEDINKGMYDYRELPFNFDTKQQVIEANNEIQELINKPGGEILAQALKNRKKIYEANIALIDSAAKDVDVDFSGFFSRQDYVHHAVIQYMEQAMADPELKRSAIGILKARDGGQNAYITDSALADFLALQRLKEMELKLTMMKDLKNQDITKELKRDENGKLIIPEGYVDMSSAIVGFEFPNEMLKTQAVNIAEKIIKDNKLDSKSAIAIRLRTEASATQKNTHYVIPSDVALAYQNNLKGQEFKGSWDKIYLGSMHVWKAAALMTPRRAFMYQTRNAISDFSKTFALMPKAIGDVPRAIRMLNDFMLKNPTNPLMLRYIRAGGMDSGLTAISFGDYRSLDSLNVYDKSGKLKPVDEIIGAITKATNGLENLYQWREQIFRLAGFIYFTENVLNNKLELPQDGNYRSSVPREIQGMDNKWDKAYKLSNDIVGAYDDTTPTTAFISKRLKPFFRFQETNNKTYFRAVKNAFYNDPNLTMAIGEAHASKFARGVKVAPHLAWRIGKLMVALNIVDLVMQLWNRIIRKEEDDQIPKYAREQSHITFGKWGNKVYFISNVGSLREALAWIGWGDVYTDIADIFNGKFSVGDKIKEILKAPYAEFSDSIAPLLMPIVELKMGKQFFSDSAIRDPWQYVANFVHMGEIYKVVTGKPQMDGEFAWNILSFSKVFENETYLWDIFTMRNDYMTSIDKPPIDFGVNKSKKSMALYNFRTSVRLHDQEAAENYFKEYIARGGTLSGITASANGLNPTKGMTIADRKNFIDSLQGQDKEVYDKGMLYYEQYKEDILALAKQFSVENKED